MLRVLYHSAVQEFRTSPIQASFVLGSVIVASLPILSSLLPTASSANPIIKMLLIQRETNLPLVIISLLLLVWSCVLLIKPKRQPSPSYEFIDYRGYLWKINNPTSPETINVEKTPYCKKHKVQLSETNEYQSDTHPDDPSVMPLPPSGSDLLLHCPLCKGQSLPAKSDLIERYNGIKSIAMARVHNHIANTEDSTLNL